MAAANRKLAELAKRQKKEGQDGLDIPLELTVMAVKADQRLAPFNKNDGTVIDVKILVEHHLVEAFVGERAALTHRCYNAAEYELGIVVQDSNAEYGETIFTK